MKSLVFSFGFYFLLVMNLIAISNPLSLWMLTAIFFDLVALYFSKNISSKMIYKISGISYLQKMFKNNPVIMEMTNE